MKRICSEIKRNEGENAVMCYASYREGKRWLPVFVILEKNLNGKTGDMFRKWPVHRRRYDLVSPEGAKMINSKMCRENPISPSLGEDISKEISKANLTKKHSNITIINASRYKSKEGQLQVNTNDACITIYCLLKGFIPFHEDPFPEYIGRFRTDVREGFCDMGMNGGLLQAEPMEVPCEHGKSDRPYDLNETLLMGTSIGVKGRDWSGTLGGFVDYGGQLCFLTCAHVVRDSETKIVQPSAEKCQAEYHVCGEVIQSSIVFDGGTEGESTGVDAALVKVVDREPAEGKFIKVDACQYREVGPPFDEKLRFNTGDILSLKEMTQNQQRMVVFKYGATTGLTMGALSPTQMTANAKPFADIIMDETRQETSHFFQQFEVRSILGPGGGYFFNKGDSGSLVFHSSEKSELRCIGLAIGMTDYQSCIVTPINEVLNKFQLRTLKAFPVRHAPRSLSTQV